MEEEATRNPAAAAKQEMTTRNRDPSITESLEGIHIDSNGEPFVDY